MENPNMLRITIDKEKIIDAAVEQIITRGTYSASGEDFFPSKLGERMQSKIEERLEEAMRSAFTDALNRRIHARAEAIIEEVVAAGFPNYDRDGRELPAEPFRVYVRKAIDQMFTARSYSKSSAAEIAERAFDKHVKEAFREETEAVRARVRAYVDEQLAGTVVKALREAVGLR